MAVFLPKITGQSSQAHLPTITSFFLEEPMQLKQCPFSPGILVAQDRQAGMRPFVALGLAAAALVQATQLSSSAEQAPEVLLGEGDGEGEAVGEGLREGDGEGEGDVVGEGLREGGGDGEGEGDVVGEGDGEGEAGEGDGDDPVPPEILTSAQL
jgi:hypothetical protein